MAETYVLIGPDNALIGGPFDEPPVPIEGQRVVIVALGYVWSAAAGGWVEAPDGVMTAKQSLALLTPAEMERYFIEPQLVQIAVAALAVDKIVVGGAQHQQTVGLMLALGVLDGAGPGASPAEDLAARQARAARILAGLPPL